MDVTKTHKTEMFFLGKASSLLARFRSACGKEWTEDPLGFCRWIHEQVPSWMPATWRVYRSALAYYYTSIGEGEMAQYITAIGSERCNRNSQISSNQKAKALPEKDIKQILDALEEDRGKYGPLLGLWLLAGRIVGLRPSEWEYARLENDVLIVRNAKTTNGRSHGPIRTLLLHDLPEDQKEVISLFIEGLQKHLKSDDMNRIYQAAKRRLHRVCRKIWPARTKYPTLYSGRHQFSADLKRAGVSEAAIAALFGHAVIETAQIHYGRKNQGEDGYAFVCADQYNINAVRKNTGTPYLQRRNKNPEN
ncbi:MAG: site-specific integrase [Syntrophotalea acetylenica]|jgi:integrase|nr:site-specific integrase [Syntrophotalea acetylenica]